MFQFNLFRYSLNIFTSNEKFDFILFVITKHIKVQFNKISEQFNKISVQFIKTSVQFNETSVHFNKTS